jgi:hypothetical protein
MSILRSASWLGALMIVSVYSLEGEELERPLAATRTDPSRLRFMAGVSYAISRNSDVIIGTETRDRLDPTPDTISNLSAVLGLSKRLPMLGEVYGAYRIDVDRHDRLDFLRTRHHAFQVTIERDIDPMTTLEVSGNAKYFDYYNLRELSFFQNNIEVAFKRITGYGIVYELRGMVGNRRFPYATSNISGFALVGSRQARLISRWKAWLTDWMRWEFGYTYYLERYDGTESTYLNTLSGLTPAVGRRDPIHSLQPEVTFVPLPDWALTIGLQLQANGSNSPYYRYQGSTPFVQSTLLFQTGHSLFVEMSYGDVNYYLRQFDERFVNTKEDFRTRLNVTYRFPLTDHLAFSSQSRNDDGHSRRSGSYRVEGSASPRISPVHWTSTVASESSPQTAVSAVVPAVSLAFARRVRTRDTPLSITRRSASEIRVQAGSTVPSARSFNTQTSATPSPKDCVRPARM